MKNLLFLFLCILCKPNYCFTQNDYFNGKTLYCQTTLDKEDKKLFELGIDCIHQNLYIGTANKIFQDLIKKDSTFCDAYFFAGYTFRLSNMNKEAAVMYYFADSLAHNKSIIFKQNLASTSMLLGNIKLAREKFIEMTKVFPDNSEGYYGIALTSTIIGDVNIGLENINLAEGIRGNDNSDIQFLKAILLTLNSKYLESIDYFEKAKSKFSKDDNFNSHFAQSLYEVAALNNDENMMKKAKKYYQKVKDKEKLSPNLKIKLDRI